ncbi:MAG: hypothetical protein PVG32_13300 [Anaerolineales bacterium]
MKEFLRVWFLAITKPKKAFSILEERPAPMWGLKAILVRFIGTSLTSILALYLIDFRPFVASYLKILNEENYYLAEIFFLPFFGLGAWLLSSALVHLILRISKQESSIDWIMNVIGISLLVVMPFVWILDWTGIVFGFYGATFTIPIHASISFWEVGLMAVGFKRMEKMNWISAIFLGLIVKAGVYIPLAAIFVR